MKRNQLRSGFAFAFARFEYTSTYIIHILNISIQAQPFYIYILGHDKKYETQIHFIE